MTIGAVDQALNAQDLFTADEVTATQAESGTKGFDIDGPFNVSISGTWVGTLSLQRSFDNGITWFDVRTFTENFQGHDCEPEAETIWRIGFKTGDFTSGIAVCRISK